LGTTSVAGSADSLIRPWQTGVDFVQHRQS
jgi:hypothetical protein